MLTDGPPHFKDAICGVANPKPSGTRKVSRKGGSKRRTTVQHLAPIERVCPLGQERAPKRFIGSVGFVPTTDTEAR
jgi:hypothetical protein